MEKGEARETERERMRESKKRGRRVSLEVRCRGRSRG